MPKTKSGELIPYMSGGFSVKDLLVGSDSDSDREKRELIMDVLKVGRGTVADMHGEDLE